MEPAGKDDTLECLNQAVTHPSNNIAKPCLNFIDLKASTKACDLFNYKTQLMLKRLMSSKPMKILINKIVF